MNRDQPSRLIRLKILPMTKIKAIPCFCKSQGGRRPDAQNSHALCIISGFYFCSYDQMFIESTWLIVMDINPVVYQWIILFRKVFWDQCLPRASVVGHSPYSEWSMESIVYEQWYNHYWLKNLTSVLGFFIIMCAVGSVHGKILQRQRKEQKYKLMRK